MTNTTAERVRTREDGSIHVTLNNLPGFHFILAPGEGIDDLLSALDQFAALYLRAAEAGARRAACIALTEIVARYEGNGDLGCPEMMAAIALLASSPAADAITAFEEAARYHDTRYVELRDNSPKGPEGQIGALTGAHMAAHYESAEYFRASSPPAASPPAHNSEEVVAHYKEHAEEYVGAVIRAARRGGPSPAPRDELIEDAIALGIVASPEQIAAASPWREIASASDEDGFTADLWCIHPEHGGQRSPNMSWDRVRHRWLDWMGMPLNPGWQPTHYMLPPSPPASEGTKP